MKQFRCAPALYSYDTIPAFETAYAGTRGDLFLTSRHLSAPPATEAQVLCLEDFGAGEPTDEMAARIARAIRTPYSRVIGIGGGAVLDMAKWLSLGGEMSVQAVFSGNALPRKMARLVLVPTTCGSGSEVTNVCVLYFVKEGTKRGFAHDAFFADEVVLVPAYLSGLPYTVYAASSLDALIHAWESHLSPNATDMTRLFSKAATQMILQNYRYIVAHGRDAIRDTARDALFASLYAGLAFSTAGCGAVHAMSYPFGAAYHVPHGEANYQLFIEVLRLYRERAANLPAPVDLSLEALDALLQGILPRRPLASYGMRPEDCDSFAEVVCQTQQRLLSNCPVPLSEADIARVYRRVYGEGA